MFSGDYRTHRTGMVVVLVLAMFWGAVPASASEGDHIQPYAGNPFYWQYKGKPIMLIGASDKDNLWQWTGKQLTDHLDLLVSVGGNYLRNTMSDRNEGDIFAAKQLDDGPPAGQITSSPMDPEHREVYSMNQSVSARLLPLALCLGIAANGVATVISEVIDDFFGTPRGSDPDIGGHEFTAVGADSR